MDDDGDELFPLRKALTAEERRSQLIEGLGTLRLTPGDLAHKLVKFGDDRPLKAILRSIDRMISGETKVSPEMSVIVAMLVRQHLRLSERHGEPAWSVNEHGSHQAVVDGWHVYISPQTRGRWILSCAQGPSRQDYSPPFGRWLSSLAEAKHKALAEVEEGMNELAEIEYENRLREKAS